MASQCHSSQCWWTQLFLNKNVVHDLHMYHCLRNKWPSWHLQVLSFSMQKNTLKGLCRTLDQWGFPFLKVSTKARTVNSRNNHSETRLFKGVRTPVMPLKSITLSPDVDRKIKGISFTVQVWCPSVKLISGQLSITLGYRSTTPSKLTNTDWLPGLEKALHVELQNHSAERFRSTVITQ